MINFNQEFKEKSVGPIDAGKYEVEIIKIEVGELENENKTKYAKVLFKIREDVDQPFAGRIVSKMLWLDKNPKYAADGWFNTLAIYYLLNSQPNGKTDFGSCDEALAYLGGTKEKKLHLTITITKDYNDDTGAYTNRVADFNDNNCGPSAWDAQPKDRPATNESTVCAPSAPSGDSVELPDDDLPF